MIKSDLCKVIQNGVVLNCFLFFLGCAILVEDSAARCRQGVSPNWDCDMWALFGTKFAYVQTGDSWGVHTWDDDPIWLIHHQPQSITGTSLNSINFGFYTFTLWIAAKWAVSAGWETAPGTCQACSAMRKQAQPWPFQCMALGSLLAKRGWWWGGSEKTQRTIVLGLFLSDFNAILWQISTINVCLQFSPIGW